MGVNVFGGLLVDLDGTLVATADANYHAYAAALREVGVIVERKEFDRLAQGRNWRQFLPVMLASSPATPETVAARKVELYATFVHLTVVNEGIKRLIGLGRSAYRTALVTTASRSNVDMILSYHELACFFDQVVTGDDVTRHKPDPEAYCLAAKRLGVPPQLCVAIEDSDVGVASAQAFGAAIIRVKAI
jgi:beta-phosphoglucomutase-like phosphatase (HAD superfamily)